MSLQIWLPFNGSLVNQGVYNSTITSTSPQYSTSGKIGKALSLASNGNYTVKTTYTQNNNEMSICFWVNPNNPNIWTDIFSFGGNNRMEVSSDDKKSYTWYVDSGKQGLISSGTYLFGLELSTWSHVAIAIDTSSVYFYVNGALTKTVSRLSTTLANIFAENAFFYVGARVANSQCYSGLINDFRIYDHCLSPKEVKEILKCLVMHYPLDNNGIGNINYFQNSNFYNGTANWGSVNSSSIRIEIKDGKKCITGTKGTSSNICNQVNTSYSYVGGSQVTFTISGDIYVEEAGTLSVGNWITTTQASGWQGMSGTQRWNTSSTLKVGWNRISVTRINGTNQYSGSIITAFAYTGTTFWLTNVKFEFGEKDTPWCPHTSDAIYSTFNPSPSTEYDTSGFKYNGTRSNVYTNSDTQRYSCSSEFDGSVSYIQIPFNSAISTGENFTINLWFKKSELGSKGYETLIGGPSGFEMDTRQGTETTLSLYMSTHGGKVFTPFEFNTWYMVTMVNDGTNEMYYINGELKKTITKVSMPSGNYFIGAWRDISSQNYKGLISDVRIYATPLSVSDILELYNTGASIDNGGNILTYDIQEK